jgi:Na+/phosphate symporter
LVGFYILIIFGAAIGFAFSNGILFALSFLGTALLPCFAVGTIKWGIMLGDKQQKIGVPLAGLVLLALAYWLSGRVSLQLVGYHVSGLGLLLFSSLVGLAVPLAWGGPPTEKSN